VALQNPYTFRHKPKAHLLLLVSKGVSLLFGFDIHLNIFSTIDLLEL